MLQNFITKLLISALSRADLSIKNRGKLTTALLDKLVALPIADIIITNDQGSLVVSGKTITLEGAQRLREGARAVLQNQARNLIHDQVLYQAVTLGVHKVEDERQMFFSRAAIWFGQRENELLRLLAGSDQELDP